MEKNSMARSQEHHPINGAITREIVVEEGFPRKAHPNDYFAVVSRYRWLVAAMIVIGSFLIVAYLMVMPQTFVASATLLPPDKSEGISFAGLLSKNAGLDLTGMSQNSSAEIFTTILRSRTLADSLVRRFDLIEKYGLGPEQKQRAADILLGGFDVSADRHGIMQIGYRSATGFSSSQEEQREAAQSSAAIVNAAIEVLDYLNREKQVSSARRTREYLGRVVGVKRAHRDSIQAALLEFQQRHRAVALKDQVSTAVASMSEIQSEIMKKEIELIGAESEFEPNSRTVQLLRSQLAELRRQKGSVESGGTGSSAIGLDLHNLPAVAREYANLTLDLEVATQVYTLLEGQYHQEQVAEARDLPTVAVLDSAQVPEYRSAPRRGLALAIAIPMLVLGSLLFVFVLDYFRRVMRAGRVRRIEEMSAAQRRLEETTTV